ncbi:hypothetical protein VTN77DRAFT_262 [Rasamsonia byssochlamydoides]|uniref:uncharacterized protein n=1 Tax=Rasamsonia byssochlamydoides TaxID=89139 RepID=UPI00374392DB
MHSNHDQPHSSIIVGEVKTPWTTDLPLFLEKLARLLELLANWYVSQNGRQLRYSVTHVEGIRLEYQDEATNRGSCDCCEKDRILTDSFNYGNRPSPFEPKHTPKRSICSLVCMGMVAYKKLFCEEFSVLGKMSATDTAQSHKLHKLRRR